MSRTGNLLFPEDDDWVASIIKALSEKEPEKKPPSGASDSDVIEDPVAIEAEAAFAETAASVPNDVVTAMRPGKTSPIKTLSKPSASRCPY